MNKQWIDIVRDIPEQVASAFCPNCGKQAIDYLYIVDAQTNIGFLQVWCNNCGVGGHISRARAPKGSKMITFEEAENGVYPLPKYRAVF